jgi:hypothetical protein
MPHLDEHLRNRSFERLARYAICLLALYAVARAVVAAHARPLWFDEIFTLAMARQPTVGAIWDALLRGVDSQGFLFDLVQRGVASPHHTEIMFRLPSILGFACTMVCVYVFVKHRSGGVYGVISAASLMLTALFIPNRAVPCAIDARAYSCTVAFIAIGLVAYQRAAALRWVGALALTLALAVSFHFYAVFAIVPFAAAEVIYSLRNSQIRWPPWIAFALGASPIAIFWPHLAALRSVLAGGFWSKPSLLAARDTYGHFLSVSAYWGMAIFIACAAGLMCWGTGLESIGQLIRRSVSASEQASERSKEFLHERALAFFLIATPFTVFVVARISHGGYFYHYMLYSILGFAVAAGFILPTLNRRAIVLASIFLLGALAMQESSFWLSPHRWRLQSPTDVVDDVLTRAGHPDLPVFVATAHDFLQLAYYAPAPLGSRLVFVADGPSALSYGSFDTDDVALQLLARCYPINVTDFRTFGSLHKSFFLYTAVPGEQDWWLRRLAKEGFTIQFASFEELPSDQDGVVYLVTGP